MAMFAILMSFVPGCASTEPGHVILEVKLNSASEDSRYSIRRGGRYWPGFSPNTDYYPLPVMEERAVWTRSEDEGSETDESITFAGKDGQPVNIDVGVAYRIDTTNDDTIIRMVRTYGPNLNQTIDGRVRDTVRDSLNMCASHMTVEQIYGEGKQELMLCVTERTAKTYHDYGLLITRVTLTSDVRLPESIKTAMANANVATQTAIQARNEVATVRAEGEKRLAQAQAEAEAQLIQARAQAEMNDLLSRSVTPNVLQLRRLEIQEAAINKWSGSLPTTMPPGSAVPFIEIE